MNHPSALELRLERLKQISNLRLQLMERVFNGLDATPVRILSNWGQYKNGAQNLHIHFDAVRPFCATYIAKCDVVRPTRARLSEYTDAQEAHTWGTGGSEASMFVGIRDLDKKLSPIASVIRLQPLNSCNMCGIEASKGSLFVPPEFVWGFLNQKLSALLGSAKIQDGQFINEIVQGSAKVIADLPDNDPEQVGGVIESIGDDHAKFIRRVRIELSPYGVEVDLSEVGDFPFKLRKMFACPVDPFKSALEWVERHGATLDEEFRHFQPAGGAL